MSGIRSSLVEPILAATSLGSRTLVHSIFAVSGYPTGVRTTPTLNTSTYATVLSITGSGAINTACWQNDYGSAHSVDVKVTIDGALVINATLNAASGTFGIVFGTFSGSSTGLVVPEPDIYFRTSLLIEAKDTSVAYSPTWTINYKVF